MEAIADITQCSICLDTFTDPRMLPCIHTFCLKCLQQTVLKTDEQESHDRLNCPICRTEITIPAQGVDGFQKNFFMLRLKEITTITKPLNKSCDICLESKESDEDEVLPADVYCLQCHKNICRRCSKAHKSILELKEHQLIPLGTEITENMIKTISQQDCPRHKNEQVKMHCNDCKEVICMVCFGENHQNHKCSGVETVAGALRQQLKYVERAIETSSNEWLRKMQRCTEEKSKVQEIVENTEKTVIRRKNELISNIDKCAQSLLDELASMKQTRFKEIQSEMDEYERQLVIIESFKAYCKEMEVKGTNIELCQVVPVLQRRAQEIQQTHRTLCQKPTELLQLDFEQTNFEECFKNKNVIGRIKVSKPGNTTNVSLWSSGKLDIPSSSKVFGVTKLENKICVLCKEPDVIRIFHDQDSFDLQMEIDLKRLAKPEDIASCEMSKCLYIREEYNRSIWKVTTEDRRVIKWLTGIRETRGALSVTNEGHLLLITYDHSYVLEIYSSDSKLIRCFCLPIDIFHPQHIICNTEGEFIISHREGTTVGRWVISRLTSDGQTVISRFKPKDWTQKLSVPCHLALDSDNNRLFVADNENDRVVLLDSVSLDWIKVLLTRKRNKITDPWTLFYDGKKKQLILLHSDNSVDVYEVTHA